MTGLPSGTLPGKPFIPADFSSEPRQKCRSPRLLRSSAFHLPANLLSLIVTIPQRVRLMFRTLLGIFVSPLSRIAAVALVAGGVAGGFSAPASAQSGYHLRPGDVVQVEVLDDPSLNRSVLVLPDGSISFPQAGTLRASGRTVEQLRSALTQGLSPNFAATPTVYVTVGSVAPPQSAAAAAEGFPVYVMGEVNEPGRKDIKSGTTLLQFLAEAGQLSRFAARNRIELHRQDPRTKAAAVYLFDLDHVAGGKNRISGMTTITEGDVIVVPQRRLFE